MDPHFPLRRGKRTLKRNPARWQLANESTIRPRDPDRQPLRAEAQGSKDTARVDSADMRALNRAMAESHPIAALGSGLILLAMIVLPWLFRKLFLP